MVLIGKDEMEVGGGGLGDLGGVGDAGEFSVAIR